MLTDTDLTTMRSVLGHFPSGVTVVTAMTDDGPTGFTCQSFSSLSLDPPLILILPGRSSSTWPKIEAAGRFVVNILSEDQSALSTSFAIPGGDKFTGVEWRASERGSPILDGVTAWIDCELYACHDGGDHTIVVGSVCDLGAVADTSPLVFHRGAYAKTRPGD